MNLGEVKQKLLAAGLTSPIMRTVVESMAVNPRRPLGKVNPWGWWVELVRGCNLKCAFCATRLFQNGTLFPMSEKTMTEMAALINELTPYGRISFGNAGEPTIHPEFLDTMRILRKLAPRTQIMTYTNGTMLINGKLTYRDMFDAGVNCVFTDMYHPYEAHEKLARESGAPFFHEDRKPENIDNIFNNRNDAANTRVIRLSEPPYSWSNKRVNRGEFHTWLNDLDWPAAEKFGITPVTAPPRRRCDLPSKFVNVNHDGTYCFCCTDFLRHTAGKLGSVETGVDGFLAFWLGQYMQDTRLKVGNKDRAAHELCSKCSMISPRADIPYWKAGTEQYWDGNEWKTLQQNYLVQIVESGPIKKLKRVESSFKRQGKPKRLF